LVFLIFADFLSFSLDFSHFRWFSLIFAVFPVRKPNKELPDVAGVGVVEWAFPVSSRSGDAKQTNRKIVRPNCRRKGHNDPAAPRGLPGAHKNLGHQQSNSSAEDSDPNDCTPLEEHCAGIKAEAELTLAENIESSAGLAAVDDKSSFKADKQVSFDSKPSPSQCLAKLVGPISGVSLNRQQTRCPLPRRTLLKWWT